MVASIAIAEPMITRILPSDSVELRNPEDISIGADGTLYIADTGHNRILSVNEQGALLSEIGSSGSGNGEFQWPKRVAAESGLNIWVADYGNRRIVKLSWQLEFQGSFTVQIDVDARPEQVSEIAASPLGDVFLYAEDSGQILRYDPLFVLQSQLGSLTGSEFIPRIRTLEFLKDSGVVFHSRGSKVLNKSDVMLTGVSKFGIPFEMTDQTVLCASGECLLAMDMSGIFRLCENSSEAEILVTAHDLTAAGLKRINAAAQHSGDALYLLESNTGSVYRVAATKL
jgi:hypothetical protein